MTADPAAVEFVDLRVSLGGSEVLHGISGALAAGSVTGLIGPSGSGKTTLMRAIVGVQRFSAGRVTVLGESAGSPQLRSRLGYVSQSASVYADLTITQNLTYFAKVLQPRNRPARTAMVSRVLNQVDLERLSDRLVGSLSGGERNRVSLAVALLGDPEVLILDEPTVGLDPVLRLDLWRTFNDLAAAGTTLLVSSHAMDEAERCEDLLLMRAGDLLFHGKSQDLLQQSGSTSVEAAFLSLIEGATS